jgi:hypothetical protein
LPQQTDTILSINTDQFERADLPKRWRKDQPEIWPKVWPGLIGAAASTPGLTLPRDAVRITRAVATDEPAKTREFTLVEARRDVTRAIRTIEATRVFKAHHQRFASLGTTAEFAVARSGRRRWRSERPMKWTNWFWCASGRSRI